MKTIADFLEWFDYNVETGVLRWKKKPCQKVCVGDVAGNPNKQGYLQLTLQGTFYYVHRLIWFLHHGEWSTTDIDHINEVKSDNRIGNLRMVTRSQNMQNVRQAQSNNQLGVKGVSPVKKNGKYLAEIVVDGKHHWLGYFDTVEAASTAYQEAKLRLQSLGG